MKLVLKPGGPRAPSKKDHLSNPALPNERAESMYSDKGPGSRKFIVE